MYCAMHVVCNDIRRGIVICKRGIVMRKRDIVIRKTSIDICDSTLTI